MPHRNAAGGINLSNEFDFTNFILELVNDPTLISTPAEFVSLPVKLFVSEEDTTDSLSKKLSDIGASLITTLLNDIERGKVIKLEKQNEENVTYAKKINKLEAIADFNNSPEVLCQKIRAFNPFPMINIDFEGKSLKIVRANIYNKKEITHNLASGKLFLHGEDLLLKLSSGILKLEEVRLEGKKTMIASDFVKGHQVMKINSVNK